VEGAIFMVAIASAISLTWSSLNMAIGRPGLSGGVFDAGRDIGGWYWTISVGAIVNLEMIDASMSVMTRYIQGQKVRRGCLKSWMLRNTEGDDQNFRGDLCPYIFVGFVSLSATEVHPHAANAGESIEEADYNVPW
jgi:hypothetical protein